MHVMGGQDMPMSPQAPGETYAADHAFGAATSSLSCLPAVPTLGFIDSYHTVYAYASPSTIHYGRSGDPDVHPARGMIDTVPLDGTQPILHWYWSTQVVAGEGPVPLPVPNVVVQATLRAGSAISVGDVAYNSGEILAEGSSAPAFLAGSASTGVQHSQVGDRHVYHFTVPLEVAPSATHIPAEGYNVRIDTYVLRDECPADGYFTPNLLSVHTSPGHRPRVELATVQPPRIGPMAVRLENDTWVFDIRANSPWGGLDVGDVVVEVEGPTEAATLSVEPYVAPFHCHCDLFGGYGEQYTDLRAVWDATADGATPGDYTFRVTVRNLQETAEATAEVPFTISSAKEAPGAPTFLAFALVALAALAARRRD